MIPKPDWYWRHRNRAPESESSISRPKAMRSGTFSKEEAAKHFKNMGGEDAARANSEAPHPLMHRTQTVDYGIVLEGELTMVLDRGETTLRAGDIVIQRGTNHAWANRTNQYCRVAFVLIDGQFTEELH
ncbi:cupin domain-containing protein [Flavobacterium sp.]|uniref:cupin domain-containing protein n=1 Tax=Flavobacterium sp. TaxID=239 RepID=UPI0039E42B31